MAKGDPQRDFARRKIVVKTESRNFLDEVDRHHLENELQVHRVRCCAGERLRLDLVFAPSKSTGRQSSSVFAGSGRTREQHAGTGVGADVGQRIDRVVYFRNLTLL